MIKDSTKDNSQVNGIKKVMVDEIFINEIAYTLKVTSNKRSSIYIVMYLKILNL